MTNLIDKEKKDNMTKKDYEIIADAINKVHQDKRNITELIITLAICFKQENSRFNTEKFTGACLKRPDKS